MYTTPPRSVSPGSLCTMFPTDKRALGDRYLYTGNIGVSFPYSVALAEDRNTISFHVIRCIRYSARITGKVLSADSAASEIWASR